MAAMVRGRHHYGFSLLEVAISVGQGMRAIRTPQWKLISWSDDTQELYHMVRDPGEQENLIAQYPAIAQQLLHRLEAVVPPAVTGEVADLEQWRHERGYW